MRQVSTLENSSPGHRKYKIIRKLGQGGMSTVYLAAEEKTDRLWAVKAMRKQSTGDFEMAKQSLLAEASILKKLKHPGLPEITEVIERENTVLIIMDYVEGYSLERIVKEC